GDVANVNRKARALGALAGVASAAVAIGLAELVAALTGPQSAPIIAVGGVVIDASPLPVKECATKTFGTGDKPPLIPGTVIILGLIAAAIGWWAVKNIRIGYAGIALFGVLGAVAAATRHGAGVGSVFPSLIGAAAGAVTLYELLQGPRTRRPDLASPEG